MKKKTAEKIHENEMKKKEKEKRKERKLSEGRRIDTVLEKEKKDWEKFGSSFGGVKMSILTSGCENGIRLHPGCENGSAITSGVRERHSNYIRAAKTGVQLHPGWQNSSPITTGLRKGDSNYILAWLQPCFPFACKQGHFFLV